MSISLLWALSSSEDIFPTQLLYRESQGIVVPRAGPSQPHACHFGWMPFAMHGYTVTLFKNTVDGHLMQISSSEFMLVHPAWPSKKTAHVPPKSFHVWSFFRIGCALWQTHPDRLTRIPLSVWWVVQAGLHSSCPWASALCWLQSPSKAGGMRKIVTVTTWRLEEWTLLLQSHLMNRI